MEEFRFDQRLTFSFDEETFKMISELARHYKASRSFVFRKAIKEMYEREFIDKSPSRGET